MADFNLEGLLGNAFGGGSGNFLDEYLSPEQRAAMQRNAMLAASAALLKAGGESTRRIGIGEALGGAFEAGQAGYEKAQTGALTQMALKTKMDEAKKAKALQDMIAGVFKPQAAVPGAAQDAAMPVNPSVARANQYRQAAQMLAMSGQGEQAMKYEDLAQKLDPRDEVQGAPIEVTNAQGNPVLLQQMKSGSFRPVVGYGAKQGAIGQPFEVTGPNGKPMLVQQLPDGTLREVPGVSAKQAAPGQPIEMTDAQGQSVMVQPMPDGTFRPVAGFTPKQAAPSQPFEVSGPNGQPMLVQQLSDGTLRPVSGASPKQAAPGEPFEVTGPNGQPVLVQKMADGSLRPVTGFAPKLDAAVSPVEVTGADGKPMLMTPQRGGGFTPLVGVGPKQNPSEKTKLLSELGLAPTVANLRLLEKPDASPSEVRILEATGTPVTMANVMRLRASGAASTTVNMPPQEKAFETGLGTGQSKQAIDSKIAAQGAATIIETNQTGRNILNSGAITGTGANFFVGFNNALKQAGVDFGYADAAANSQAYAAAMGANVGQLIKQFGAGTGLSDADREFAMQMAGGKITLTEQALRKILDINDKAAGKVIDTHNRTYGGVKTNIPLTVEKPAGAAPPPPSAASQIPTGAPAAAPAANLNQQRQDANAAIARGAPAAAVRQRFKQNTGQEL